MLGHFRQHTHHLGDVVYTGMERTFLTVGVVLLTLAALLVTYFGIVLIRP